MAFSLANILKKPEPEGRRRLTAEDRKTLAQIDANHMGNLNPMIQISGVCNLKCTMCGGARDLIPGKFMDKNLFITICEKLKADGIGGMIIAGAYGEPFLHPQIFELLEHAKGQGFNIVLSTHGNNLDEAKIARLAELDLAHVQFSFCGYDATTYERIYKGGKFEKATANIKLVKQYLKKRGTTQFKVNGVCDEDDPSMARRTADLLKSLGVEKHEMRIILPHNFGGKAEFEQMEHFESMASFKHIPDQHLSVCKVMADMPGILWDGRISACGCLDHRGQLEIGNIKFSSLSEVRQSPNFRRIVDAFREGNVNGVTLCDSCDVPYGDEEARPFKL